MIYYQLIFFLFSKGADVAKRIHGQGRGRPAGAWWPNGVSARFSDEQLEFLDKPAGDLDVSMAGLLRMLVDDYLPKLIERERARERR